MKPRVVLAIILNLTAIAVPAATVYHVYGFSAGVNPQSGRDLFFLLGTLFFSCSLGLLSGWLLLGTDRSSLPDIVETALKGLKPEFQR